MIARRSLSSAARRALGPALTVRPKFVFLLSVVALGSGLALCPSRRLAARRVWQV